MTFDEGDQRRILAGLAGEALRHQDRGEQDDAERYWDTRERFVDCLGAEWPDIEIRVAADD